jgi:hypothetical protein
LVELMRVLQIVLLLLLLLLVVLVLVLLDARALLCVDQSRSPLLAQVQAAGLYRLGSCTAGGCSKLAAVQL